MGYNNHWEEQVKRSEQNRLDERDRRSQQNQDLMLLGSALIAFSFLSEPLTSLLEGIGNWLKKRRLKRISEEISGEGKFIESDLFKDI